jgi:hypothetical protein
MPVHRTSSVVTVLLPLALSFAPARADAQFRYPPIYPPYPAYRYAAPESNLRVLVRPKDASVYVDGYFAGKVEEFDGTFERLHVAPGGHEIVVYLEGFRSLRQQLYLNPNATRKIEGTLEKLATGEPLEPIPTPAPDMEPPDDRGQDDVPLPQGARPRLPDTPDPRDRRPPPRDPRDRPAAPSSSSSPSSRSSLSGTLSIRVQPDGASVLIDGEHWDGPRNNERLIVQVPEGQHRVEVQREGYAPFVTDIEVRRGETAPVNVSLRRER